MPLEPPYDANWITLAILCRVDNAQRNDFPDQGQLSGFTTISTHRIKISVMIRGEIGKTWGQIKFPLLLKGGQLAPCPVETISPM
jgi:hypothetical protein